MQEPVVSDFAKTMLGKSLAKIVTQYLEDPEHRREFEEWYFNKYGVKYQWKTVTLGIQHGKAGET